MHRTAHLNGIVTPVLLLLAGCSGLLVMDTPSGGGDPGPCEKNSDCPVLYECKDGECVKAVACSAAHAEGTYCPEDELECACHVCVTIGTEPCCGCPDGQGCNASGQCVEPTLGNMCQLSHPYGVCPEGDVCVRGVCQPYDDPLTACAPERRDGACPPGYDCVDGYCLLIDDEPCGGEGVAPGEGRCWTGEKCDEEAVPPHCAGVSCEDPDEFGECPLGEVCVDDACVPRWCDDNYTDGWCEDGKTCSEEGCCVAAGECARTSDCEEGLICSCAGEDACAAPGTCIAAGTCSCDTDCGEFRFCDKSSADPGVCRRQCDCMTPDECPTSAFCTGVDWCSPDGEFCGSTQACLPAGTCMSDGDCQGPLSKCSVTFEPCVGDARTNECVAAEGCHPCIGPDECRAEMDCREPKRCVADTCITGECVNDIDCLPGHLCNGQQECVPGPGCTGNLVTGDARVSCTQSGIDESGQCCPDGEICCSEGYRCSNEPSPVDSVTRVCVASTGDPSVIHEDNSRCLSDADCLAPYYTCDLESAKCVPATACPPPCPEGQTCSGVGCIPGGHCIVDTGCREGERCSPDWVCVRMKACEDFEPSVERQRPNLLMMLDRSGSMELVEGQDLGATDADYQCCGSAGDSWECDLAASPLSTRWEQAKAAVDAVTLEHQDAIKLGLGTYPRQWCGARACNITGNWCTCDPSWCEDELGQCADTLDTCSSWFPSQAVCGQKLTQETCEGALCFWDADLGACVAEPVCEANPCIWDASSETCIGFATSCVQNYVPGIVNVPVPADNTSSRDDILQSLASTHPGGGTPTGPTLRSILADADSAGLASSDVENFIILITDGAANGDKAFSYGNIDGCPPDPPWPGTPDYACKVNVALDSLRALPEPIKTFVVGFAFATVNAGLNCHAAHGGAPLSGGDAPCATLGVEACAPAGCIWTGVQCLSCSAATDAIACNGGRCEWDADASQCLSHCAAQNVRSDQAVCEKAGCTWDAAGGTCQSCSPLPELRQAACEGAGCVWDGACLGCGSLPNQAACEAGHCVWDEAASPGAQCVGITVDNCADATTPAYFSANDADSLVAGLNAIIDDVIPCDFALADPPPYANQIYVFLVRGLVEEYVPENNTLADGWHYLPSMGPHGTIKFEGMACERVKSGQDAPLFVFGCVGEGG